MGINLNGYVELLRSLIETELRDSETAEAQRWRKDVASIHKRQRAYGLKEDISAFTLARKWKRPPASFIG